MLPDPLHSLSAGQETARLPWTRNTQCPVHSRIPRGTRNVIIVHKYKASRYVTQPVTAAGVTCIILITSRSSKYVSKLLSFELTARSRVLLEKLTVTQLIKNFVEPEGTLPQSKVSATCPYPEPARSTPYTHILPAEDPF